MSIELLLDQIRQRLSPSEGQMVVKSLQQDPLVWQFINDQESQPYFTSTQTELVGFQPWRMARWLIESKLSVSLENLEDLEFILPSPIKKQSAQALETIFNTGLPPADLFSAGLLVLTLRESRIRKSTWHGLSEEIFLKNYPTDPLRNYQIWRTPFACAYHLFPDFSDAISEFISTKSETTLVSSIPILIHAILSNPMPQEDAVTNIFSAVQNLSLKWQLESLKWLKKFNRNNLVNILAKNLIQTKHNRDIFSKIFSEMETFQVGSNGEDAIDKEVRYSLPEDIARLAAFHFYSGDKQKAADLYQRSCQILDFQKAQTSFQSLTIQKNQTSPAQWLKIIQSIPNSKQAQFMFIHSLIKEGNFEEASRHLDELPPSYEKELLNFHIQNSQHSTGKSPINISELLIHQFSEYPPVKSNSLVHKSEINPFKELLQTLSEQTISEIDISGLDSTLRNHINDTEIISLARDVYEKYKFFDKAIELTSILERTDPSDPNHKRTLARLYSTVQRWQEAFSTLQVLVKSESNPDKQDLEKYAEAALRTDHIDMAISICQNILKQAPRNTKALVLLGEGYMLKGDVVKSIQHMEQVVEMIPEEPETWLTLSRLWQNIGKTDRSFEILGKGVLAIPNDPALLREMGKAHLEKKAPADALICLRKAYEIDPNNLEGKVNYAQAKYQLGQFDQAWQILKPLMADYKNNPIAAKLLGQILLAMDEKVSAEPILIYAAEQFPDDIETIISISELLINNADVSLETPSKLKLEKLATILHKSVTINPGIKLIHLFLTDVDRNLDLNQQAFDSYCKLSEDGLGEHSTFSWRIPYGMGKTAMALGKRDIGLAALKDANNKSPENLIIFRALAEAYQAANFQGKAHDTAQTTLRMAPQDVENVMWYANFKINCNETAEAVKALKVALQINPERSELKLWLSKTLKAMGEFEESREVISDLIINSSSNPQELHKAAYLCVQLNELDLAVNALEKSKINLDDSNPILVMDLAVIYSLMDQRKKALNVLHLDDSYLRENPQLILLKSDLLCNLGQYSLSLNTLSLLDKSAESDLAAYDPELIINDQSPLLYNFDFSYKGYLLRLGQIHRALGEMEKANEVFSRALYIAPNDIHVQNAALESFLMSNEIKEAVKIGKQAISQLPDVIDPDGNQLDLICSYAEGLIEEDEIEDAKRLIKNLTNTAVNYPRYHAIQSLIAVKFDEFDIAKTYLVDAETLMKSNQKFKNADTLQDKLREVTNISSIARAAQSCKQYQLALKLIKRAYQKFSHQPMINWQYAKALILIAENQRIADSVHVVNHLASLDSLSLENQQTCMQIIQDLEQYVPNEALSCQKARASAAFTGSFPTSLSSEIFLRDPESAAALLAACENDGFAHEILNTYPSDPDVLTAYGMYALKHNKKDGLASVEKALHYDTSDPIKHILLALLSVKDQKAALKSLETALDFWPDEPEWHSMAADLYSKVGESELASEHISAAIKHQPENADYWQRSAEIRIGNNEFSLAIEDLKKSSTIEKENPDIWMKLADLNRRIGNISEAYKNYETAGELDPENITLATKEIDFLIDQKEFKAAEMKAEELFDKEINNPSVRILLAQVQAKQGKFDQALETLAVATRKNPGNILVNLEKLKIRKDRDHIEPVLPDLISLAEEHPNHPEVLSTLTDWLIQMNRLKEAELTAQSILRTVPEHADVHLMLGRLQKKKGQLDQAVAQLSKAITYNPMLIEAYIELGKTYQERNDLELAISTYQKGSKADASDPRPYYFTGVALKECKDYVGAEKMLKQAKRYAPHDSRINRQLGVVKALNLINNLRETS